MRLIRAKKISYGSKRNKKQDVKYIVIHGTGNVGDTAKNNCEYYKKRNKRHAGAHIFVDRQGVKLRSIPLNRVAYSVGGDYRSSMSVDYGGAGYYNTCNNANSVSIELCDVQTRYPSKVQVKALADAIKYVQKYCPKAKVIIRHFDVNGKCCPSNFICNDNWSKLKKEVKAYGINV